MAQRIPADYRRVLEQRVDRILERRLSEPTAFARWMIAHAFGPEARLSTIVSVAVHVQRDHRRRSGDPLAYGETDVELVAMVDRGDARPEQVALLIENKVDAKQMENQGLRYRARGTVGELSGAWSRFRSMLVAPQRYLVAAYPLGDHRDAGWDRVLSFEDIAAALGGEPAACDDVATLREATAAANAWNDPIPDAVRFWKEYEAFGREQHRDVPVLVPTQVGSRAGGVWPSFYEPEFRGRKGDPWRRRVQIVHVDNSTRVSLFVKRVAYEDFVRVVEPVLEPGIALAAPGTAWQSVRIEVPAIDPSQPFTPQAEAVHEVFRAARRLHAFFAEHEAALRALPVRIVERRRRA